MLIETLCFIAVGYLGYLLGYWSGEINGQVKAYAEVKKQIAEYSKQLSDRLK